MRGGIGTNTALHDCFDGQGETWVTIGQAAERVVARLGQQMRNARPAPVQRPAAPLNATTGGIVAE